MKKQLTNLSLNKKIISSFETYLTTGGLENTVTKASGCTGCPACPGTPTPQDPNPATIASKCKPC